MTENKPDEFTLKILAAMAFKIKIPECEICEKSIYGIPVPGCIGECDLPIELKNDQYGRIKVLGSNLKGDKWDFPFDKVEAENYDTYVLFNFDKDFENLERAYAIPKKEMEKRLSSI